MSFSSLSAWSIIVKTVFDKLVQRVAVWFLPYTSWQNRWGKLDKTDIKNTLKSFTKKTLFLSTVFQGWLSLHNNYKVLLQKIAEDLETLCLGQKNHLGESKVYIYCKTAQKHFLKYLLRSLNMFTCYR